MELGSSSAELLLVGPSILEKVWPHAEKLLEDCKECWEDYHTLDTLHYWIQIGRRQLWMANTADKFIGLALTEMRVYPLKLECAVVLLSGRGMKDLLLPLFIEIEEWARQQGATTIYADGRLGWERMLRPLGYERRRTIVEKSLTPGRVN